MSAEGEPLLRAHALAIGRAAALIGDVQFALAAGECWFVLGRNGVGKTTLLHTLLGLLPPRAGQVWRAPAIADRSGLGFVPQEVPHAQSLPCTVAEFVELGVADRRLPRAELRAAAAAALTAMQLGELPSRRFGELSLGQRRRALVARALLRRPRLLVLDEPTASLDPGAALAFARDLERLRRDDGLGLLHCSHDLALARAFATHLLVLDGGRALAGPAAPLFASGAVARALGVQEVA